MMAITGVDPSLKVFVSAMVSNVWSGAKLKKDRERHVSLDGKGGVVKRI
jgi:hypothetical protein